MPPWIKVTQGRPTTWSELGQKNTKERKEQSSAYWSTSVGAKALSFSNLSLYFSSHRSIWVSKGNFPNLSSNGVFLGWCIIHDCSIKKPSLSVSVDSCILVHLLYFDALGWPIIVKNSVFFQESEVGFAFSVFISSFLLWGFFLCLDFDGIGDLLGLCLGGVLMGLVWLGLVLIIGGLIHFLVLVLVLEE